MNTLTFGDALIALKEGKKVARSGWNGKGMFLFLGRNLEFDGPLIANEDEPPMYVPPSIIMKTADNQLVVGWLASQTDMLANDWGIV